MTTENKYARWLESLGSEDVGKVGGKNASLGEMIRSLKEEGIRVPEGFATTSHAYWRFLEANHLTDEVRSLLQELDQGNKTLARVGKSIRRLFRQADFPQEIEDSIRSAYRELTRRSGVQEVDVAVRSSATAEDLPEASFAGQQETFLNITGEVELLEACKRCYASLFTDRAIAYRQEHGFDHLRVALSVGIQRMVRSDKASAGVMFTIDTDTGFPDVVVINAGWGLGENVVQGSVTPDEAVKRQIGTLIEIAHQEGCKVGICGQAPSDHPEFAAFLVKAGIDSISLNPDSVIQVKERVAEVERAAT